MCFLSVVFSIYFSLECSAFLPTGLAHCHPCSVELVPPPYLSPSPFLFNFLPHWWDSTVSPCDSSKKLALPLFSDVANPLCSVQFPAVVTLPCCHHFFSRESVPCGGGTVATLVDGPTDRDSSVPGSF